MNCATHTDVPATAYCRTCGKPLCDQCKRDIHGVIYCQDCLAARMHDTMPTAAATATAAPGGAPQVVLAQPVTSASPGLAFFLGLIPFGVGAVYNGQYLKGLVHLGIFIALVYGVQHAGPLDFVFGLAIAFFIGYQAMDAYRTAKARQYGMAVPDDLLGLNRLGAGAATDERSRPPLGAIVLVGLGVLFLLGNAGLWSWTWFDRFWPVALIAIGAWLIYRRQTSGRETQP